MSLVWSDSGCRGLVGHGWAIRLGSLSVQRLEATTRQTPFSSQRLWLLPFTGCNQLMCSIVGTILYHDLVDNIAALPFNDARPIGIWTEHLSVKFLATCMPNKFNIKTCDFNGRTERAISNTLYLELCDALYHSAWINVRFQHRRFKIS